MYNKLKIIIYLYAIVYTMATKQPVEDGSRVLLFLDGKSKKILNLVENKSAFTRAALYEKAEREGIPA